MLTASLVTAVLPSLLLMTAPAADPTGCTVVDTRGRCLVTAVDPGRPGARRPAPREDDKPGTSRRTGRPPSTPHVPETPAEPQPRNPQVALPIGQGWAQRDPGDLAELLDEPPVDEPAVAAAVAPEVLVQRAIEQLTLPPPAAHTSALPDGVVGVPMWLWIDGGAAAVGPLRSTATAGAAQVTAVARLTSTEWSMGPRGARVRCAGTGTPWTGQDGPSPDCGYVYRQRSLPERTGGTGRWPVVVTGVWTVTWTGVSGGAPVDGQQEVRVPAELSVPIGEVQVLVDGDGS